MDSLEIKVRELFEWVADHSSFSTGPPFGSSKNSQVFFEWQYRLPKVEASPAIVKLALQKQKEARVADELSRVTLGKLSHRKSVRSAENGISWLATGLRPPR